MQVQKVTDAVKMVKEARPDLMVEGPLQYDAAIDPTVAAVKIKTPSEVAGRATVFIFPDLNTGNNTYKAVQQVGNFNGSDRQQMLTTLLAAQAAPSFAAYRPNTRQKLAVKCQLLELHATLSDSIKCMAVFSCSAPAC
jgi:hypothetical protein